MLPRLVVLTGAGISAESGIRTFRDHNGLWENHRIEEVATPEAFARHPERVQQFYNQRRRALQQPDIQPNAAHRALVELEQKLGEHFLLVTQNVDNLHERAGNRRLRHLHGELMKARCLACNLIQSHTGDIQPDTHCQGCHRPALRPHIVWFGEMPLYMDEIDQALAACDLFLSIGTSGQVYPAAGFAAEARRHGARCVEINLEPSHVSSSFHERHHGPASEAVPRWVAHFLAGLS